MIEHALAPVKHIRICTSGALAIKKIQVVRAVVCTAAYDDGCAAWRLNPSTAGERVRRRTILKTAGLALAPVGVHAQAPADFYFTRLKYESGDWNVGASAASTVLQALGRYTNLRVDPREHVVALGDARMLEAPFCYLTGRKLAQFSSIERKHFERYVRGGGFVLVDDAGRASDLFARSLEAELARMFGPKALRELAAGHPLYSSFFPVRCRAGRRQRPRCRFRRRRARPAARHRQRRARARAAGEPLFWRGTERHRHQPLRGQHH